MRAITDYVSDTSLPAALKEELAGSVIMQQHALYVHLPTWLAPLFGSAVSQQKIDQLSVSSYFYFRFLLVIDKVLDTPVTAAAPQLATVRLLTYCNLFEQSVRGLSTLFPADDLFWTQLDECKKRYAASNQTEKKVSAARGSFSLEAFEALAEGKSAVCYAVVYALASLGGTTAPVADLLSCLRHLHIALQCMDDVDDFRADWEQGQYTYAHAQVEEYLRSQGLDPAALTAAQVYPYLYTSGTADALYTMAQKHFIKAVSIAKLHGLAQLMELIQHHVYRCGVYRTSIATQLARAQERVAATPVNEPVAA